MKLTLVRHGQSLLNAQNRHQYSTVPLSEQGRRQAQLLADRLQSDHFNRIISSPLQRARETAEIIATKQSAAVELSDLLQEIRRPAILMGTTHEEPAIRVIWDEMIAHMHEPNWHYADEENWWDVKKRVEQFLSRIEQASESNILVVSHGMLIRMVLSLMIRGRQLNSREFLELAPSFPTENTCVSVAEFEQGVWSIKSVCDFSHLNSQGKIIPAATEID